MKLLGISIILSIVCISQVAYSQSGDEDPQMGAWKLNETQSKVIRGNPKADIQVFEPAGDQVKVTMDGTDKNDKPFHNEWVGKFDGKDYPLTGTARYTRSYKKIDDRTLEVTNKNDGKITFHNRHVVSADGKSRTVTPIQKAQESQSELVYYKQTEESGQPPTLEHHRLAPEGVSYLMERVSIQAASGVSGFAPGTLVRMVQDKGETFVVTAGSTTFEVAADQLTNDIDLGDLVARRDATSQNMIADFIRQQNEADRQARDAKIVMFDQQQREVDAARAAAEAAKPHPSGALNREAYNRSVVVWPHRHYIYYQTTPKTGK